MIDEAPLLIQQEGCAGLAQLESCHLFFNVRKEDINADDTDELTVFFHRAAECNNLLAAEVIDVNF